MDNCCRKGFQWEGTPVGREDTVGDRKTYVTGDNTERAIFLVHDGVGWEWGNSRLLADHYAKEIGATVYMPDFFGGFHPTYDDVTIGFSETGSLIFEMSKDFDWAGWSEKNGAAARLPEVVEFGRVLRKQYRKLAAVGYCWGGLMGFKLAAKKLDGLFDCVSIAHPGTPSEEDIKAISVPFQILAAEHDPSFGRELQDQCNLEIPKLGLPYHYQFFPGVIHGFATKCDMKKENEKAALELAKNAVVFWFKSFL